ncbi:MAG: ATP synthase F0 subunit B [bacterium]
MISLNVEMIIIHMIFFLIMIWVLHAFLFKPILKNVDARKDSVDGNRGSAREMDRKADELYRQYSEKMEEARKDAVVEKDKLKRVGESEEDRIIKEARQKTGDMIADLRERIAADFQKARQGLQTDTEDMGKDIARRVLGREVSGS